MNRTYQLHDNQECFDIGILKVSGNNIDDELVQQIIKDVYYHNYGDWQDYDELFDMINEQMMGEGWTSQRVFLDDVLYI